MPRFLALDIETTGLTYNDHLLTVAAAWRDDEGVVQAEAMNVSMRDLFSQPCTTPELFYWLRELAQGPDWLVFHNAAFDLPHLLRIGVLTEDICRGRIFDTMVMARHTGDRESVSLGKLCRHYGIGNEGWQGMKKRRKGLAKLDAETVIEYNKDDARNTLLLVEHIHGEAEKIYSQAYLQAEGDFILLAAQMQVTGMAIDLTTINRTVDDYKAELAEIQKRLMSVKILKATDNVGLRKYLLSQECLLIAKTAGGKDKLDVGVLQEIQAYHQGEVADVIEDVLRGRHLVKALGTWLVGIRDQADEEGRVHPLFKPGGTVSGRLSCKHPNVQAIPRGMKLFIPGRGVKALVSLDYAQAELRLAAIYAGEVVMAKIFQEPDADPHLETARAMYGDEKAKENRFLGKSANFATIYGAGPGSLSHTAKLSQEKAKEVLTLHRQRFPRFRQVSKAAEARWAKRGFLVLSSGRRRFVSPSDRAFKLYKAFNQLVQGSVACVMQTAMLGIHVEMPQVRIVSQVHDSILIEVMEGDIDEACHRAVTIMEDAVPERIHKLVNPRIAMKVDVTVYLPTEEAQE
ncbi:MAG: ribonuclease H-like domain-containing protein [Candidatus Eisenbacteria sp.]|nr:ribonuclease H-like domain-containing protein [Candidatus Eisenbacteria bacterium]